MKKTHLVGLVWVGGRGQEELASAAQPEEPEEPEEPVEPPVDEGPWGNFRPPTGEDTY